MVNIVIFGGPGSGKGTQSDRLIHDYGLFHISTGELLRNSIAAQTELGKIAESYISKGNLIPDDLVIRILLDELKNNAHAAQHGVIYDGFPRTVAQAEAFEKMLAAHNMQVDAVVGLEVAEEELVDRLLKRGVREGREDDASLDVIKQRINVYNNRTSPVKDYYKQRGSYHEVNGHGSVDAIYEIVKDKLKHLNLKKKS